MAENNAADGTSAVYALVFAVAHEIGNYLGAIRLRAHLLDEDLDPRALATASVEIDAFAGRAGPLLALLRPLLAPEDVTTQCGHWSVLFTGIRRHMEDEGTRGVVVEIQAPAEADHPAPEADWLHSLLIALIEATLSSVPKKGLIQLGLEGNEDQTTLFIEDDGPEEDLSPGAPLRGRPLAVSIARRLVASIGGRVETSRADERTRVELIFPPIS